MLQDFSQNAYSCAISVLNKKGAATQEQWNNGMCDRIDVSKLVCGLFPYIRLKVYVTQFRYMLLLMNLIMVWCSGTFTAMMRRMVNDRGSEF